MGFDFWAGWTQNSHGHGPKGRRAAGQLFLNTGPPRKMPSYKIACLGIQLTHSGGLCPEVTDLIPGGSAESDGVLRGDRIFRVEDEDISGLSSGMSYSRQLPRGFPPNASFLTHTDRSRMLIHS